MTVITPTNVTREACAFIEASRFENLPQEAIRIGRRCILDGLALYVAGSDEESVQVLIEDAKDVGGKAEALLLGGGDLKIPAALAARVLGTAGHAHDWDDTQVSRDPAHVYGLLTHPTVPPLTAALVMSQKLGNVSGRDFLNAFITGVEVESKISEWMQPDHYKRGLHSSGTVGTFGAVTAAATLMGLKGTKLAHAIGIARRARRQPGRMADEARPQPQPRARATDVVPLRTGEGQHSTGALGSITRPTPSKATMCPNIPSGSPASGATCESSERQGDPAMVAGLSGMLAGPAMGNRAGCASIQPCFMLGSPAQA